MLKQRLWKLLRSTTVEVYRYSFCVYIKQIKVEHHYQTLYIVYVISPDGANPVDIQSRPKRISTGYTVTSKPQQSHFPMRSSKRIQFTPTHSRAALCWFHEVYSPLFHTCQCFLIPIQTNYSSLRGSGRSVLSPEPLIKWIGHFGSSWMSSPPHQLLTNL